MRVSECASELQHQPRLADAGFARDEDHLSPTGLDLGEKLTERSQWTIAPDQRR